MSPALVDDYLDYFSHVAFCDHEEWSECYCLFFHWDDALETECPGGECRRRYAAGFIRDGIIRGYLAYMDGRVVGWCNANDKTHFKRLAEREELWEDAERGAKVKSVVCFAIAPGMRRKGIAARLLDRVCRDAAAEGCAYVEAYPFRGETDVYANYHGPYELYMKHGFTVYKDLEKDSIVRKYL